MNVSIPADVVFRDLGGEGLIMHMGTGTYFGLDTVGTRIWHLLALHGSVEPAVMALQQEYEVNSIVLRRDVERLVKALSKKGLLKLEADSGPVSRRAR